MLQAAYLQGGPFGGLAGCRRPVPQQAHDLQAWRQLEGCFMEAAADTQSGRNACAWAAVT